MRRLLHALLLPVVVAAGLLLPAPVASADGSSHDDPAVVRLATEAEGEEVGGLEPGGANDPDNENRPDEYEPNFLWAAAVGLTVLTVGGLGALALLYRLMVARREAST